jgi:hypothetical protein
MIAERALTVEERLRQLLLALIGVGFDPQTVEHLAARLLVVTGAVYAGWPSLEAQWQTARAKAAAAGTFPMTWPHQSGVGIKPF